MARTRAPDYEQQREAILARAERAFAASGFPSSSMATLARACGTSKARLYHYYESKEAILFDLLKRYTRKLVEIAERVRRDAEARKLDGRAELRELIRAFLREYRSSRYRHVTLLNDVKFLAPAERERVLALERDLVERFAATLARAFPGRVNEGNRKPLTMMLFGMINWTFTWLRPEGRMSYGEFADLVADVLEAGVAGLAPGKTLRRASTEVSRGTA